MLPNAALVGVPGSREKLVTPALVLDLDILEANIARMADHCRRAGIALRPHAKTHKSARIARLQIEAGAIGICCATIGEAEIMVGSGIGGVLITSPVVHPANIERLVRLHGRATDLMCVVDHPDNVRAIADRMSASAPSLRLLVDVDIGLGRTGASTVHDVVSLAKQIDDSPHLSFAGVQGYAGHVQHIESVAARAELAAGGLAKMAEVVDALAAIGKKPAIVSGGGTGTHDIDFRGGVFTELQAGSYTVMDVEYADLQWDAATPARLPFQTALFVRTTVISNNAAGMVTTDAGLKRFATDGPRPRIARGAPEGAVYALTGDEHGCVVFADASQSLPLGAAVECVVPHCDPTVNLYDHFHCVRGDTLVDLWPVDARGAY
ncbi:MAG TPA: DSD1 family PLP-dependent enzyme [Candidatus Limnocylindrales bacterium]|nr:DSD1 family PLP-dependent enzyme [Candidatus Limnocylindrales bacterium]